MGYCVSTYAILAWRHDAKKHALSLSNFCQDIYLFSIVIVSCPTYKVLYIDWKLYSKVAKWGVPLNNYCNMLDVFLISPLELDTYN